MEIGTGDKRGSSDSDTWCALCDIDWRDEILMIKMVLWNESLLSSVIPAIADIRTSMIRILPLSLS